MICLWNYIVLTVVLSLLSIFFSVLPIDCSAALSFELTSTNIIQKRIMCTAVCSSAFTLQMIAIYSLFVTLCIIYSRLSY